MKAVSPILRSSALLFAAFLVGTSALSAAPKKAPARKSAERKTDPIDMLISVLRINSAGDYASSKNRCTSENFKLLAQVLSLNSSGISRPKGEFETSEEYSKFQKLVRDVFYESGPIWICEPLSEAGSGGAKYSADTQRFSFDIYPHSSVHTDEKDLGEIRGRTVGGVPFTYSRALYWRYRMDLAERNYQNQCAEHRYSSIKFEVPVDLASAPKLKATGTLIIEARIIDPYIRETTDRHTASLTEQYDEATRNYEVPLEPVRYVVVDGAGREVWSCRAY